MKLAILLLCHKNAEQINLFLEALQNPDIEFFIHMDKKADIVNRLIKRPDVYILPDSLRVDVKWGGYSMIEATLNLLKTASSNNKYDYYWLCSGQDFPIVSSTEIIKYFQSHQGLNFISIWPSFRYKNNGKENHYDKRNQIFFPKFVMGRTLTKRILKRCLVELTGGWNHTYSLFRRKGQYAKVSFYYGPNWCALTNSFICWALDYIKNHPWFSKGYKNSSNPDESFFQTLFMMSPYKNNRHDYIHYIDWSERPGKPRNSPNTLTLADYDKIKASHFLMARKFDMNVDKDVINKLIKCIQ